MLDHLRALRPHQWVKNGFVFAALVFSRKLTDVDAVLATAMMAAAFSAVASSIYLVNDVADYERDRAHPTKRNRPIAADKVRRPTAIVMALLLAPIGIALGFSLDVRAGATLAIYGTMNLAYSFKLKHVVLLDVFIIAAGFLLRVSAGAFAIDVGISPWLLLCTFFIALFLAFCKRRQELVELGDDAAQHRGILAEYSTALVDQIISALAAMTVMSYALYTIDPRVVERLGTDGLVMTLPFVLFGVFRYLFLVHKRDMGASPTRVALTDRGTQLIIVLYLAVTIGCIYFDVTLGLTRA